MIIKICEMFLRREKDMSSNLSKFCIKNIKTTLLQKYDFSFSFSGISKKNMNVLIDEFVELIEKKINIGNLKFVSEFKKIFPNQRILLNNKKFITEIKKIIKNMNKYPGNLIYNKIRICIYYR
jgi:hypothetical protein